MSSIKLLKLPQSIHPPAPALQPFPLTFWCSDGRPRGGKTSEEPRAAQTLGLKGVFGETVDTSAGAVNNSGKQLEPAGALFAG